MTAEPEMRLIVVTRSQPTRIAVWTTALRKLWQIALVDSADHARKLLAESTADVLFYDIDTVDEDWRALSCDSARRGVGFQSLARAPSDELFLAAIGAGCLGVLWKPITSEKIVSAMHMHLVRSLAEHQLVTQTSG